MMVTPVAMVKKALITPLRDWFAIEGEGAADMEAKGDIVDHEYKIERDGGTVAEISRSSGQRHVRDRDRPRPRATP